MRFVPPEILSVLGLTASNDPDLPDGRHLRFVPAPELGPPLAPIAVWRANAFVVGRQSTAARIARASALVVNPPEDGSRVLAASVDTGTLAVLDRDRHLMMQRSPAPAIVAAPRLDVLRPGINGAVVTLYGLTADRTGPVLLRTAPELLVPVPLTAPTPWYAGAIPPVEAMKRVGLGAPRRQTVLDQPALAPQPLTPGDEMARVAGAGDANLAQYGKLLAALFTPAGKTPPASRRMTIEQAGSADEPPSSANLPLWGTLAMQAVDYGAARYLGLGAALPPVKTPAPAGTVDAVVAVALFALPPDALTVTEADGQGGTITRKWANWPVEPGEAALIARMIELMPGSGLAAVVAGAKQAGLSVRAALTAAALPPPLDAPDIGPVSGAASRWIAADSGASVAWRQRFTLSPPGVSTALAIASTATGALRSRNELDQATGRRRAMLVGRDPTGAVLVFDQVEAAGAVVYQFAASDPFGRFGPAQTLPVPPPPRPAAPRPVPQVAITRSTDLPPDGPASPGTVTVTVPVPTIEQLAAGARPITGGLVELNGTLQPCSLANDTLSSTFPLPPLAPMAKGNWVVSVVFTDADGTSSPPADLPVAVADGRAPPVLPSGPGLIWTSRPAAAPLVEAPLLWSAMPGSMFHVYEASAASLAAAVGPTAPDPATLSRAAFAQAMLQAAPSTGFPRSAFARLTEQPVVADASGTARFAVALPQAQRTVAFLRVMSVSPTGVESDFAKAGLVPVAVPDDLPPPPPRVSLAPAVDGAPPLVAADGTAVRLAIEATGLDLARLKQAFPGTAPDFRLRRASGPVDDPLYALILTPGAPLDLAAGTPPQAVFTSIALKPFVRYTWWAEVRMPPEPALPAGVTASPHGLKPEFPSWQQAAMPSVWSRISAPFSTIPAPATAPTALLPSQVGISLVATADSGWVLNLSFGGLPVAAGTAVDCYKLRIWTGLPDSPLALVAEVPITGSAQTAQISSPAGRPARCWIAVVDPFGRESSPFKLDPL